MWTSSFPLTYRPAAVSLIPAEALRLHHPVHQAPLLSVQAGGRSLEQVEGRTVRFRFGRKYFLSDVFTVIGTDAKTPPVCAVWVWL